MINEDAESLTMGSPWNADIVSSDEGVLTSHFLCYDIVLHVIASNAIHENQNVWNFFFFMCNMVTSETSNDDRQKHGTNDHHG